MSLRSDYMKARKNAQARYRRLEKKGYSFEENPIPAIPKKITEGSIRRLNKLTARELREQAEGYYTKYGERYDPVEGYKLERRRTYERQRQAQRLAYRERVTREKVYSNMSGLVREKGETHKQFIARADRQIEEDFRYNYYDEPSDNYFEPVEEATPFDTKPDTEYDEYENWTVADFEREIENAYDSQEFYYAKELEWERDKRYQDAQDIAKPDYHNRFQDAIDIVNQFSPEIANKLRESFDYYMERKGGLLFDEGLTPAQLQAFENALAQLEDVKYLGNQNAMWSIYSRLDRAINSRHHTRAERNAFFARIQSGDFQYD